MISLYLLFSLNYFPKLKETIKVCVFGWRNKFLIYKDRHKNHISVYSGSDTHDFRKTESRREFLLHLRLYIMFTFLKKHAKNQILIWDPNNNNNLYSNASNRSQTLHTRRFRLQIPADPFVYDIKIFSLFSNSI